MLVHGGYNNHLTPSWFHDLWMLQPEQSNSNLEQTQQPQAITTWVWSRLDTTKEQPKPSARYSHTLVGLANQPIFYLFGGDDGGHQQHPQSYEMGAYLNDVWRFELTRDEQHKGDYGGRWMKMSFDTGPTPRTSHSAVVIQASMFVFGGLTTTTTTTKTTTKTTLVVANNELWAMAMATESNVAQWTLVAPYFNGEEPGEDESSLQQPQARYGHTAAAAGTSMYVFGGKGKSRKSTVLFNDLWSFHSNTTRWTLLHNKGHRPVGLLYGTMSSMLVGLDQTRVLVLYGGASGCSNRCFTESKTWVFDVLQKAWSVLDTGTDAGTPVSRKSDAQPIQPMHRYRHAMATLRLPSTTITGEDSMVQVVFGGETYGEIEKYRNDVWVLHNVLPQSGGEGGVTLLVGDHGTSGRSSLIRPHLTTLAGVAVLLVCLLVRCCGSRCRTKTSSFHLSYPGKK